jgi:hypothetical protein
MINLKKKKLPHHHQQQQKNISSLLTSTYKLGFKVVENNKGLFTNDESDTIRIHCAPESTNTDSKQKSTYYLYRL